MGPTALRKEGRIEVTDPTVTPKETFQNPVLDNGREETWRDSAAGWLSCTLSGAPREHWGAPSDTPRRVTLRWGEQPRQIPADPTAAPPELSQPGADH